MNDRYAALRYALSEEMIPPIKMVADLLAERDSLLAGLNALWALWNDQKFVRMKADYTRGHLSYANTLNEKERPIVEAIAAAEPKP
jgi:hypothetical protein